MHVVKVVVQRVSRASVSVAGQELAAIGPGLCLLVGVGPDDTHAEVDAAVSKLSGLRIFADDSGQMNRSVIDIGGEILVVSQFTLYADVSRGRRPSFSGAGDPGHALGLIEQMVAGLRGMGIEVGSGEFGAKMEVELVNDGPVTLSIQITDGKVL